MENNKNMISSLVCFDCGANGINGAKIEGGATLIFRLGRCDYCEEKGLVTNIIHVGEEILDFKK